MLGDAAALSILLCGWMSAVIVGSLWHDPFIWQDDLPEALRATLPPPSPATRRRKTAWGVPLLIGLVAFVVAAILWTDSPAEAGVAAFLAFEVFNLFDALVIDVGLILLWAPDWAVPPGVRGHPSLRDPKFHIGNWAKGAVGGIVFGGFVAAVAWGVS